MMEIETDKNHISIYQPDNNTKKNYAFDKIITD